MFDLLVIALLCLIYAKGTRAIVAYRDREQDRLSAAPAEGTRSFIAGDEPPLCEPHD